MSGVNPISGSIPPIRPATGAGPVGRSGSAGKSGPGSAFMDVINQVDEGNQKSALAIQDLIAGRSGDVLSVVSDVARADLSFKLLIGVRNKIIEAYKQTMNMQI